MKTPTAVLVLAAALGTLRAAPALAGPQGCANCHEPNDKDKAPLKFSDGTAFSDADRQALIAFLKQPDNPTAPKDPPSTAPQGSQNCANCHTSKNDPFNKPQPQFYAWAPTAQPKSPPCNFNCHTPNGANKEQNFDLSHFGAAQPLDEKALRDWLGMPDQPGNPATALVDQDSDPNAPPKDKPATPKPAPKSQTTPAQHKTAAKPQVVAAKPQLDAAASDDDGDAHFDGADGDKPATTADEGVDAKAGKTKKSPAGEAYPKPKGVSSKIADVPWDPANYQSATPAAGAGGGSAASSGAQSIDAEIITGTGMGGGAGMAIGALAGGPIGGLIGLLVGAGVGGLLGGLLSLL